MQSVGSNSLNRREMLRLGAAGAGGLLSLRVSAGALSGVAAKFLDASLQRRIIEALGMRDDALLLALVGQPSAISPILGRLRVEVAQRLELDRAPGYQMLWVNEFPLFERDPETGGYSPCHHLFSMPFEEDIQYLESDPLRVRANFALRRYRLAPQRVFHRHPLPLAPRTR